jgi:hypothetical protein
MPAVTALEQERELVLDALYRDGAHDPRILVHGSIAHTALRGVLPPPARKFNGDLRDIDVHISTLGADAAQPYTVAASFTDLVPIDFGMSDILVRDGNSWVAKVVGAQVELKDAAIFDEEQDYEVPGHGGLLIRSFSPLGMYALHLLGPGNAVRLHHPIVDQRFLAHCYQLGLQLPKGLAVSIEVFQAEYRRSYAHGQLLKSLSQLYANVLPESFRKHFRPQAHRFMKTHTGRETPFAD